MRHHAQLAELMVDLYIIHHQHPHGKSYPERHCPDHHHCIGCPRNPDKQVIIDHVIHKIDQRHTWHDKQGTSQQRLIRCGRQPRKRRSVRQTGRYKRRNRNTHIHVNPELNTTRPDTESDKCTNRSKQKCNPVTAEQLTETTTGKPGTDRHQIRHIVTRFTRNPLKLFLIPVQRIVLFDSLPRQTADLRNGRHIDAMLLTLLKLGKGMRLITHIHHDHRPSDIQMKLFFRNPHESCHTLHVPFDAVRIRRTLHQQFSRTEQ